MKRLSLVLVAGCLLGGCDKGKSADPAAAASAEAAAAPPAPPPEPPKPWYFGSWTGKYDARQQPVVAPKGVVREWESDAGTQGVGSGSLSLEIDEAGAVSGRSEGALGALSASGQAEEEHVRVRLTPEQPGGFSGVLVLERAGENAKGRLHASTGDSLNVRVSEVELTKGSGPSGTDRPAAPATADGGAAAKP
ncbi:MAG TPA: hypothetical protein VKZ49_09985 [Polyangiaceae bacterium]|nr:hypothetical protein [Polyangiaceae bacterium]